MKKVEAIIRKTKFRQVKKALINLGIKNFSYWLIRNVGEESESRVYRGVEYETSAVERIHLSLVVDDSGDEVVRTITQAGTTGQVGDGRIFVTDLSGAFQLITRNEKDEAISLKK